MELRKFLSVFTDQNELFIALLLFPLVCTTIYTLNQPITYESTLTLTIVRSAQDIDQASSLSEDEYDSYYRLSADEKFAQTIKQWLLSPSIVDEILQSSNVATQNLRVSDLEKEFTVTQESPQVVSVKYKSHNPEVASTKAQAITKVLNNLTKQLDTITKTQSWFVVQAQEPLTRQSSSNFPLLIMTSLTVGLCLGILGTLLRYYYKKED